MSHSITQPTVPSTHSISQVGTRMSKYRRILQLRTGGSAQLWTLFAIAMVAVFVARVPWLFPNGIEIGQLPGEYYHFRIPLNKAFLWTHLACILPAGLLAVFQFVPRVRMCAARFHRHAGRIVNILSLISTICAWGMARISFGGDLATQSSVYLLGIMTIWSTVKSWTAIRRLQIDEHRIWIIRAWSYQALVITERVIMVPLIVYISTARGYYTTIPCSEVAHILNNEEMYLKNYPQCQPNWTGSGAGIVPVEADPSEVTGLGFTATIRLAFGASMWIAIWIHAIATEYYLFTTQNETNRLRELSTKRQNVRRMLQDKASVSQ